MKLVSESLGVSRSRLTARIKQAPEDQKARRRRVLNDAALVDRIKASISDLPSYGYRRVWALLRRQAESAINVKRVYRVMRDHDLLLKKRRKQPGVARRHEGRVAVGESNTRWCSDGFEFRCDDGAKLRVTFALDCCDREAISWVASPSGYCGDDVRDVMLEAVEKRFGQALPVTQIQWLSDNGSAYIAEQTRAFAREIGLIPLGQVQVVSDHACSPADEFLSKFLSGGEKPASTSVRLIGGDSLWPARNMADSATNAGEYHSWGQTGDVYRLGA